MKIRTIDEQQRLHQIARNVREAHETATQLVDKAQKLGCEAITEAMLCGVAANEARRMLGEPGFKKWIAKHCKNASEEKVRGYMRLANSSHVVNLKDAKSLRKAYVLVGILPPLEA